MKLNLKSVAIALMGIILFFTGCDEGDVSNDSNNGKVISAQDGGSISYNNGEIIFTVPEGALQYDTAISIKSISAVTVEEVDGLAPFGQAYRFTPEGTEFNLSRPAVMEMKYDESLLARKGYSPETLALYYYDEEHESYVAVDSFVDVESGKIIAQIEHFTLYVPMAKAKLADNNAPYVALQNSVPNPIRVGAPIYLRATVRDYDGAIAGARLYYRKLKPVAGEWQDVAMQRVTTLNTTDTYGFLVPSTFLSSSDLGQGYDFEYYVTATDNLGASTTCTTRSVNINRTFRSGSLSLSPSSLNICAGFQRSFTLRGTDTNNSSFNLVPENMSLVTGSGTLENNYSSGVYYTAQTVTLVPDQISLGFGTESQTADINVYAGDITSIEILDTNGQKITGDLVVAHDSEYEFDAVGYDDYGNTIPVLPQWSADATVGAIDNDGILSAYFTGPGNVYISLGNCSDDQALAYTPVSGVAFASDSICVSPGGTEQTSVIILPEDATVRDIEKTWQSSDISKAVVSETGMVTGIAEGDTTITVSTVNEGYTASCNVRIRGWMDAELVEHDDLGHAYNPFLSFDSNGNAIAVWEQSDGSYYYIWSNRFTISNGWGDPEMIETTASTGAYMQRITVDPSGNAFAVWSQKDGYDDNGTILYDIWMNHYTIEDGWDYAELMETDTAHTANSPGVACDINGNAIIVWYQEGGDDGHIFAKHYFADTGLDEETIIINTGNMDQGSSPRISFDSYGNAIAIWHQYDDLRHNMWAKRYVPGVGWGISEMIETDDQGNAVAPQIAFDKQGNAIAVWHQYDGTRYNIWSNRYVSGVGWGEATLIENDDGTALYPRISIDSNGNAIVIWKQSDGNRQNVLVNWYIAGVGWSVPGTIETDDGTVNSPLIVFDKYDNAMAVWSQYDGIFYSVYSKYYIPGLGWGELKKLENSDDGQANVTDIQFDKNGNAIVIWYQHDGSIFNIWASRFE